MAESDSEIAKQRKFERLSNIRYGFIALLLIIIILSALDVVPIMDTVGASFVDTFRDMGVGGGVLYCLICALLTVLCFPSSLLALAGGYIWENTIWGFLAAYPGIMLGCSMSFFLGRKVFKEFLEAEMSANPKFMALSQAAEESGMKVTLFARLSPIPTGMLNYGLSISKVSFKLFIGATAAGLIPLGLLTAKAGSDFFTYFETSEVQDAIGACRALIPACCELALDTPEDIAAFDFGDVCPFNVLREVETKDSCLFEADVALQTTMSYCLNNDETCDFATIISEASDLMKCKNEDFNSLCAETPEDDPNNCLRKMNETELWPKVVLPVVLVLTLVIVGFFVKRGLDRAALLQVSFQLDKQRELLVAERQMMAEQGL